MYHRTTCEDFFLRQIMRTKIMRPRKKNPLRVGHNSRMHHLGYVRIWRSTTKKPVRKADESKFQRRDFLSLFLLGHVSNWAIWRLYDTASPREKSCARTESLVCGSTIIRTQFSVLSEKVKQHSALQNCCFSQVERFHIAPCRHSDTFKKRIPKFDNIINIFKPVAHHF